MSLCLGKKANIVNATYIYSTHITDLNNACTPSSIQNAFDAVDVKKTGSIDKSEFKAALTNLGLTKRLAYDRYKLDQLKSILLLFGTFRYVWVTIRDVQITQLYTYWRKIPDSFVNVIFHDSKKHRVLSLLYNWLCCACIMRLAWS